MSAMDECSLERSKTWRQWRVFSYNPVADNWVEHCTGSISTQYETTVGPVDAGREEASEALISREMLEDGLRRCTTPISISYDSLDSIGSYLRSAVPESGRPSRKQRKGRSHGCYFDSRCCESDAQELCPSTHHTSINSDSMIHLFHAGTSFK